MKNIFTSVIYAGVSILFVSCDTLIGPYGYDNSHHNHGYHHNTGAPSGRYDNSGVAIYGYENGRPVYGYTQVGRPVHAVNQLYSGCYVPSWGRSSAHTYPYGVNFSANPPRLYDNSNIEAGDSAPRYY